jgi:hypothetical protein
MRCGVDGTTDILVSMKYFTYELIAAANDWTEQCEEMRLDADRRFWEADKQYHSSLQELRPRISGQAWHFFENGHGRWGLHDGRLISLSIGDGLDYRPDGTRPFRVNHQRTVARILFLNHEQDLLYTFDLRGVDRMRDDLLRCEAPNWCLGDLFTYEITAIDKNLLQLGFLFASGATIVAEFTKLIFRRQRIKREYPAGDMYR